MPASFQRERLRQALADSPLDAPLAGQRCAAIALVLLEVDTGLEALLIERAERSGDPWSGHMALPGGHLEERDVDLGAAAERETLEEVASICVASASDSGGYRTLPRSKAYRSP
jgi:8-oxo-dGTP pyrophosphatase MutT (NUDIX family)